jgi:hypothetical protein
MVDWASDVRRYAPDADETAIAGIVRHCGFALSNRQYAQIHLTDRGEMDRIREHFMRRTLGLTLGDNELDGAISATASRLPGGRGNRVTIYYLLARRFCALDKFNGSPRSAVAFGASDGMAVRQRVSARSTADVEAEQTAARGRRQKLAHSGAGTEAVKGQSGFDARHLMWLLLPLMLAVAGLQLTSSRRGAEDAAGGTAGPWARAHADGDDDAPTMIGRAKQLVGLSSGSGGSQMTRSAPAPATGDQPRVVSGLRDGLPHASIYFANGRDDLADDFADNALALRRYLGVHSDDLLSITAYVPHGDTAQNARARAIRVKLGLIRAGIDPSEIVVLKPAIGKAQAGQPGVDITIHQAGL